MTTTEVAPPAQTDDQAVTPTLRATGRRVVFWVVLGLVALLIVGLLAVLGRSAAVGEPLASDNPAPGARWRSSRCSSARASS